MFAVRILKGLVELFLKYGIFKDNGPKKTHVLIWFRYGGMCAVYVMPQNWKWIGSLLSEEIHHLAHFSFAYIFVWIPIMMLDA